MAEALQEVWLNAMDVMEQGGRLTVRTQREQGRVIVTISDTGTGVKPDDLDRLFELGFTTRLGRTVAGVGLALARASFTRLTVGVSISRIIPMERVRLSRFCCLRQQWGKQMETRTLRLLIVDDDELVLDLLTMLFNQRLVNG